MKKILLLCVGLNFTLALFAQRNNLQINEDTNAIKGTNSTDLKSFYEFEIPSVINGSNLDPSGFSSVKSDFTASKISLKLGSVLLFKDPNKAKHYANTFFIKGSLKANNGVSTLYKDDNPPLTYSYSAGYSRRVFHRYWVNTGTQDHTSEQLIWLSVIGERSRATYNFLTEGGNFGQSLTKDQQELGSVFFTVNHYYHTELKSKKQRLFRNISSIGLGYVKTNNYSNLDTRTLNEGILNYNADSSNYESIVKTTEGAIGEYKVFEGLAAYAEYFIPLYKSMVRGNIFFGNRLTFYAIDKDNRITNMNSGFYFNIKNNERKTKPKTDIQVPSDDLFSLSVTAQFDQIDKLQNDNYFDDYFRVQLQLGIPLRFR